MSAATFVKRVFLLVRPFPWLLALLGLTLLLQIWYLLLIPLGMMEIFDRGLRSGDVHTVALMLFVLAIGFVSQTVGGFAQERVAARLAGRSLRRLRDAMFAQVQLLSDGFLRKTPSNEIVASFAGDLASIETALVRGMPNLVQRLTLMVGSLVTALLLEWRLALAACVILPAAAMAPRLVSGQALAATVERRDIEARIGDFVRETLALGRVIRVFRLQDNRRAAFARVSDDFDRATIRAGALSGMVGRLSTIGVSFLLLVVIGLGSALSVYGLILPGVVVAFILILLNMGAGAMGLAEAVPLLLQGAGGMARIDKLMAERSAVAPPPPAEAEEIAGVASIAFDAVSFSYTGEADNLTDVSFSIEGARSVAFVGTSGSGKSTILNLLLRHYDATEGRVLVNGIDIRRISDGSLRRVLAVVAQETGLFSLSIAENIRMGREDASEAQVVEAAKAANIHDEIARMPDGYATEVGDLGARLSGGQRQRIAIARALIRKPQLLVLDEATASLDPASEDEVHRTIMKLHHRCMIVAVTHRLHQAAEMDRIYVLDRGRLVEQGTHGELVARGGPYAGLWAKQSGLFLSDDGRSASISVERLRHVPFLEGLDDALLEELAQTLQTEAARPGDVLFAENDISGRFYIVVRGEVELTVAGPQGRPITLEVAEIGDFFGEFSLLDENLPQFATARANGHCVFLAMSRDDLAGLLDRKPELHERVVETIDRRLDAKLEELVYRRQDAAAVS
ncbi:ATP-binding cassette, subfamily B [Tistlia consotensis]|uniref:ATP-binding cassette, subfamily B n=1 Tax=Tistlia consotensis USBA 355 TaxID=560819 RepID=A0A1Y6CKQ3_9PROT|nr:ATP-binding cassette domain-containing protein [Tistlia consotensis]SMF73491.1 ATP-binding cassette, subfamily B [Tistlia consotensis USBA 355]SNS30255.1 ATP-binding cassette, subfamily B [Tistlia consotensis]